jgi:hypothetical protein
MIGWKFSECGFWNYFFPRQSQNKDCPVNSNYVLKFFLPEGKDTSKTKYW